MRILSYVTISVAIVLAFLWIPANNGIHAISPNAAFFAGEWCSINYEDGGDAINVVNLSNSNEFESKVAEVKVTRDLGQMRIELEACQRFDAIWRENPPSNEKATHNHFVTIEGEVIQVQDSVLCAEEDGFVCKTVKHACDGHYNFVTVNERATHNHLVTIEGEFIQVQDSVLCAEEDGFVCKTVKHACDGHYNFVTVTGGVK